MIVADLIIFSRVQKEKKVIQVFQGYMDDL